MATLEKIRQKGVLLAIIIGVALFAFIIGDFLNTGSLFSNNQFEIAEVAGKSIPLQEYQAKVEYMKEVNKLFTGKSTIDEATNDRIMEQTWAQLLQEYILNDEYKELGIGVSADEFEDMVYGENIHPIISQIFADPKTGTVNINQIKNFLRNLDQDQSGAARMYWKYIESEIIRDKKYAKYNNLIQKGLFVNDLQAKQYAKENGKKTISEYFYKKYSSIADSLITFTNADLEKYYAEHKNEYKQNKSRDIAYITFDVKPSEEDYKYAEKWINDVYPEFKLAEDPYQYVTANSDEPYLDKNYSFNELDSKIKDFVAGAPKGDIFGPYFEEESYKVSKLADIVYVSDSVKVRHILIQPKSQNQLAYNEAKATADSLFEAIKKGANFEKNAREFSDDKGSAAAGGELGWFPEGVMVKPFSDACFSAKAGEIKLIESNFGFHIINVIQKSKEVKKYKIATVTRKVTPSSKTYQDYFAEASKFAGVNNNLEKFNAAVKEQGLNKRYANDLKENQKEIRGLDASRNLVKWAFEAKKDAVSEVFTFGDTYVIAALVNAKEEGFASIEEVRADLVLNVKKQKKAERIIEEFNSKGTKDNFEELATSLGLTIKEATNLSFNSFALSNEGIEPKVIAIASSGEIDKVYGPIEGNNGVFMVKVIDRTDTEIDVEMAKTQLANTYRSRYGFEAYEALKDISDIKDRRAKFY